MGTVVIVQTRGLLVIGYESPKRVVLRVVYTFFCGLERSKDRLLGCITKKFLNSQHFVDSMNPCICCKPIYSCGIISTDWE